MKNTSQAKQPHTPYCRSFTITELHWSDAMRPPPPRGKYAHFCLLIFRWPLGLIDDENLNRSPCGFEFEPELLLERRVN
jgi:hypothetical protein